MARVRRIFFVPNPDAWTTSRRQLFKADLLRFTDYLSKQDKSLEILVMSSEEKYAQDNTAIVSNAAGKHTGYFKLCSELTSRHTKDDAETDETSIDQVMAVGVVWRQIDNADIIVLVMNDRDGERLLGNLSIQITYKSAVVAEDIMRPGILQLELSEDGAVLSNFREV